MLMNQSPAADRRANEVRSKALWGRVDGEGEIAIASFCDDSEMPRWLAAAVEHIRCVR
jgi:hypothetical protein